MKSSTSRVTVLIKLACMSNPARPWLVSMTSGTYFKDLTFTHCLACVAGALFFRGFGVGGVGEEKTRRRKKSARKTSKK